MEYGYHILSQAQQVEEGYSEDYEVLAGPNGFRCMLGEPEDRTFYRDLSGIVGELNRLHDLTKKV